MKISVVIPCYKSEKSIKELIGRLLVLEEKYQYTLQIILVNDCSPDGTMLVLRELSKRYDQVEAIDLMFNVGQFRSLLCGLEHATGDYVVTMDDDLQHPPEEIPKMLNHLVKNEDIDVVLGKPKRKEHNKIRNIGSLFIRFVNTKIFKKPKSLVMSPFRVLRKCVVDTLVSHRTMFPVIGPLILKSTNRIVNVEIQHNSRAYGTSNYTPLKLIKTTFDNIINFSSIPLKMISFLGLFGMFISVLLSVYFLVRYFIGGIGVTGWTSSVLMINFYGGLTLFSIGIIGEYLIRILFEVNGFPKYKIRNHYNK